MDILLNAIWDSAEALFARKKFPNENDDYKDKSDSEGKRPYLTIG
jgi:hypothetical protein